MNCHGHGVLSQHQMTVTKKDMNFLIAVVICWRKFPNLALVCYKRVSLNTPPHCAGTILGFTGLFSLHKLFESLSSSFHYLKNTYFTQKTEATLIGGGGGVGWSGLNLAVVCSHLYAHLILALRSKFCILLPLTPTHSNYPFSIYFILVKC